MKLKKQVKLQPRDYSLLQSLADFRFLSFEHIQHGIFNGLHKSTVSKRLSKLKALRLLEVIIIPSFFSNDIISDRKRLYLATRDGIQRLNENKQTGYVYKQLSVRNMLHDYLSIHFLMSAQILSKKANLPLLRTEDDRRLWKYYQEARKNGLYLKTVIPDASITFQTPRGKMSFQLEVVNADVRGGNKTLLKKFQKYAYLIYHQNVQKVFDQEIIRAVLILTTGQKRIKNMQALVSKMDKGKNLFWFASFRDINIKTQALENIWVDYKGESKSILSEIL